MHHSKDHMWWLNVCSAATGLYKKTAQCFFLCTLVSVSVAKNKNNCSYESSCAYMAVVNMLDLRSNQERARL